MQCSMRILLAAIGCILALGTPVFAQEDSTRPEREGPLVLVPVITGQKDIATGRTLVLDASASLGVGEETTYQWFLDDTPISSNIEMVYTPEEA